MNFYTAVCTLRLLHKLLCWRLEAWCGCGWRPGLINCAGGIHARCKESACSGRDRTRAVGMACRVQPFSNTLGTIAAPVGVLAPRSRMLPRKSRSHCSACARCVIFANYTLNTSSATRPCHAASLPAHPCNNPRRRQELTPFAPISSSLATFFERRKTHHLHEQTCADGLPAS